MTFIKNFDEYLKENIDLDKVEPMERMQSIEEVNLPDGTYDAIIGGYHVDVKGTDISFKTNTGVRCRGCECTIDVINKKAFVIL